MRAHDAHKKRRKIEWMKERKKEGGKGIWCMVNSLRYKNQSLIKCNPNLCKFNSMRQKKTGKDKDSKGQNFEHSLSFQCVLELEPDVGNQMYVVTISKTDF